MKKTEVYLHSFRPVLPLYHLPQEELVNWTLKSHERTEEVTGGAHLEDIAPLKRFGLSSEQIQERYFECNEVDEDWDHHAIYDFTREHPLGADIFERNNYFCNRATDIFSEIYTSERLPEHLIHVTCTGYVSPSPPQRFFHAQKVAPDITHAYHMGCYASLPSVRMAQALVISDVSHGAVDIVHTEMCSLHFNPSQHTPEQIVVQTLFADGHIKYSADSHPQGPSFKIKAIKEQILPGSAQDMTWVPSPFGMQMTLSREVPQKIGEALELFLNQLCEQAGMELQEIKERGIFAVHPGGPKIISAVQEKLQLRNEQVEASKKILKERGNMSSATLPHVWDEILKSSPENGTPILSLAFGPGLTIFGSLFEVVA